MYPEAVLRPTDSKPRNKTRRAEALLQGAAGTERRPCVLSLQHQTYTAMGLLPGLKRRSRPHNDTSREAAKWGWYTMAVFAVAWFIYSLWFDK